MLYACIKLLYTCRIILRRLKFRTQSITIFGLLMTISGYSLLGDWQSIPYDPCTEFSPFHHPNLTQSLSASKFTPAVNEQSHYLIQGHLTTRLQMTLSNGLIVPDKLPLFEFDLECQVISTCSCDPELTFYYSNVNKITEVLIHSPRVLGCTVNNIPSITVCIIEKTLDKDRKKNSLQVESTIAHVESIQVVSNDSYWTARNNCMNADVPGHTCHWIPSSLVTKKECRDCPLICRSISQTLTFTQFCIGLTLLLFSNPFVFFPSAELVFNQVYYEYQVIAFSYNHAIYS